MKTVIVYSSATGNTARLAQELSAQLNLPAMPLAEAEGWQDADRILAGFWTDKGSCDEKMAAFLSAGQKAAREHVSFSAEEQELLIQILMEGMSGEERKKAEAVRKLAGRIQKNRPGA